MRELLTELNGGSRRSAWVEEMLFPKAGVNGVRGVFGVEMYRPLHLGQRTGASVKEAESERTPLSLPARRG